VTWVDGSGNLWLFGGYGFDSNGNGTSFLNDLWMFNTTTNQWTWVSGSNVINPVAVYGGLGVAASTNMPGGRFGAAGWTDQAGNLWIFGGYSVCRH
jgi:N-acetylneuraminic acid mutarotase